MRRPDPDGNVIPDAVPSPLQVADLSYADLDPGRVLGTGGNAVVRRATAPSTAGDGATVALKEPHVREEPSADLIERFRTEAEIWARLDDHEGIVAVHDWETDPHPWIAAEYMDGGSLRDRVDTVDVGEALWVGVRLADAVHHAHRHTCLSANGSKSGT